MKYFEYLVAGLPVVSALPEFKKDGYRAVATGGTPEEFIDGIVRQVSRGRLGRGESVE